MVELSKRFVGSAFRFIPGPVTFTEPLYSWDVQDIAEHSPDSITTAILSWPGTTLLHPAGRLWSDWQAAWEEGDRIILLDDVELLNDAGHFGGLRLSCDCLVGDVLALWAAVRADCPGIWLYGHDCRLYTPQSFLEGLR
jgi:hypothetical protein